MKVDREQRKDGGVVLVVTRENSEKTDWKPYSDRELRGGSVMTESREVVC